MTNNKKKTNIAIWAVLALIATAVITMPDTNTETNSTQRPAAQKPADVQTTKEQAEKDADMEAKKQKLLEYFRSGKEPEAQNVMWVDADWFYVAVWNEGGGKQGYAEYVCSIASKMGLNKINVKITDFGQALRSGNVETIATESCK